MSDLRFKFESEGTGLTEKLNVVNFEGYEAISQLYRFNITLVSNSDDIDADDMLNNTATLTIKSHDGNTSVPYHGMLCEFEQLGRSNDFFFYRAVLVPRLWKLTLNKFNDVYTGDKTIPQIIESVLNDNGLSPFDYEIALKNPFAYRGRSFICQYQESSFNFISRWMEKEGLYYYFDQGFMGFGSDKLKITDFKESQPVLSIKHLTYCAPEDLQTAEQDSCIFDFRARQVATPQKVIVQDYNYRKADLADGLKSDSFVDMMHGHGDVMHYGENLRDTGEASHLATIRAEEIKCRQKTYKGKATAVGLRAGNMAAISNHFRFSLNGAYTITAVKHTGTQAGVLLAGAATPYTEQQSGTVYECEIDAIGAGTQFRAASVTPRPSIAGTLSALIDDEGSGKYAQLNEYGDYKVELMYDLSDKFSNKGSSWVRMASPYAGPKNGMHFPLLKGTEVLLAFMGGDPDQPVIIGAVSNSESPNVVTDENVKMNGVSTAGGNMLAMCDDDGAQGVCISSPSSGTVMFMGEMGSFDKDPVPPMPFDLTQIPKL
jgi:type VI secretion system secreted protein VgrG